MGCDAYGGEYILVVTPNQVLRWTERFPTKQIWFPENIYEDIDLQNDAEIHEVEERYMEQLRRENIVWTAHNPTPLKGIYVQALRELEIDPADVFQISRGYDVSRRS